MGGDRPPHPKGAHTRTEPAAWWGGCCPSCGPAGSSTEGARILPQAWSPVAPPVFAWGGFWGAVRATLLLAGDPRNVESRPSAAAGAAGGEAELGAGLERSCEGWRFPGKAFLFQPSRQEPGQAEAASGGFSLPDVACSSSPLVRHPGAIIRLQ